jgi:hypothetical protein
MVAKKAASPTKKAETKSNFTAVLKRFSQRSGRVIVRSSLPETFLVATLSLSRYLQNSDFSYPSEIILNIVLLGLIATVVFYIYKLILRNTLASHVAGLLLVYGLYGFTYSFPRLHHWGDYLIPNNVTPFTHDMLQSLFLGILFGLLGWIVGKIAACKQLQSLPLLKFLVFVVCFIFAVQLGKVGLRVWEIRKDLAYKQPASSLQMPSAIAAANTTKPNVYYLLFDRYANAETLQSIYNYDNSAFLSTLSQQGFVVRGNAFANYPFTTQSVSSTLAAGYHTEVGKEFRTSAKDFQTAFPYRQILDNSPVTQAFKQNGYQYNQVSSWWDFTRLNPSADTNPSKSFRLRIFGKNFWLSDLQRDIVNKSILSPLLLKGVTIGHDTLVQYQLDRNPTQNFYAEMHAIKDIAKASGTQTKPQFTFAHILSPHDPYIFDAEGNKPTYDSNRTDNGVDETIKYTNQVTFLNTQIEKLVTAIRTNDPSAAIVIQADEGPYPKQFRGTLTADHYYDPKDLPTDQARQKFGILAAYYLPGVDQQTASQNMNSSVNAFRFILNNYLGYTLLQLPDCQFTVGDKYNLYTFNLISGKLKNIAQPSTCAPYK